MGCSAAEGGRERGGSGDGDARIAKAFSDAGGKMAKGGGG